MTRSVRFLLVVLLVFGPLSCAFAQGDVAPTGPALEKRMASFDPKAVAAAKHYYLQPAVKAGMVAMTDNMNKAVMGLVAQQNPGASPEKLEKLRQVVGDVTKERLDLILQMSMVVALETFSTDELVALDNFYSSRAGVAILNKMPKISAQLPAMMRSIMPDYTNEIKERLKQNGAELKL